MMRSSLVGGRWRFSRPLSFLLLWPLATCAWANKLTAEYSQIAPQIDGVADDPAWQHVNWHPIDQLILGEPANADDFSGRYALRWDEDYLYLLAVITDDVVADHHPDPRQAYWDDDSLEVFIDEDGSGGLHQFDYNAFAYHIAIDNQVADIGPAHPDGSLNVVLLNDHLDSVWQRQSTPPFEMIWEVRLRIYDDTFNEKKAATPVKLHAGKNLGFMLAYCDSDISGKREHFYGSHPIAPVNGDMNRGYIDASVFATLHLLAPTKDGL